MEKTEESLHIRSLEIISRLMDGHTYSYKMFRRKFLKYLEELNDDELFSFWFDENGDFYNMRLYKYLVDLGFRKVGTVLRKVNIPA